MSTNKIETSRLIKSQPTIVIFASGFSHILRDKQDHNNIFPPLVFNFYTFKSYRNILNIGIIGLLREAVKVEKKCDNYHT